MNIPKLEPWCNSWIISCKDTGEVLFETYSIDVVNRISQTRCIVKTAYQHLTDLNKTLREEKENEINTNR
tara:strand:+ start:112 stop:321 length:210 start_codon:yes stop_codon:yes gene_type:complete